MPMLIKASPNEHLNLVGQLIQWVCIKDSRTKSPLRRTSHRGLSRSMVKVSPMTIRLMRCPRISWLMTMWPHWPVVTCKM